MDVKPILRVLSSCRQPHLVWNAYEFRKVTVSRSEDCLLGMISSEARLEYKLSSTPVESLST